MTKKTTEAQKRALACLTFSRTERLAMGADFDSPGTQIYNKLVKVGLARLENFNFKGKSLPAVVPTAEGKEIARQYCHEFVAQKG
jgi:hypothetical protein